MKNVSTRATFVSESKYLDEKGCIAVARKRAIALTSPTTDAAWIAARTTRGRSHGPPNRPSASDHEY
jgi:hypothetical protein